MDDLFVRNGRQAKALKLAWFCRRKGVTVETLARATDAEWRLLASLAGCNPPSADTRAITVDHLAAMTHRRSA